MMKIPLIKPNSSEEEAQAVAAVIRSSWINEGERVAEFERLLADYLALPCYASMTDGEIEYMTGHIERILETNS